MENDGSKLESGCSLILRRFTLKCQYEGGLFLLVFDHTSLCNKGQWITWIQCTDREQWKEEMSAKSPSLAPSCRVVLRCGSFFYLYCWMLTLVNAFKRSAINLLFRFTSPHSFLCSPDHLSPKIQVMSNIPYLLTRVVLWGKYLPGALFNTWFFWLKWSLLPLREAPVVIMQLCWASTSWLKKKTFPLHLLEVWFQSYCLFSEWFIIYLQKWYHGYSSSKLILFCASPTSEQLWGICAHQVAYQY